MARKSSVPRKVGGQYGNQNAKGKKHGAPKGSKYGLVTGEYETITMDNLTDDEREFIKKIRMDKIQILQDELVILSVRERRMLRRIEELLNSPKGMNIQRITSREVTSRRRNGEVVSSTLDTSKEVEPVTNTIQRIEEGLTRVQARRQALADQIHRIEVDSERYKLDRERLDLGIVEQKARIENLKASTARLTGADPERMEEARAQVTAIADLINHPDEERKIDDYMTGAEPDDPVRATDEEAE